MDELTIMEVPEPPSMGTTGSLLMEQIPKVREKLTRGHDWDDIALKATSSPPDGRGTFCEYDDNNDPDVKSVAALFAAGEHEQWGNDAAAAAAADVTPPPAAPRAPSAAAVAAVEAARAAQAEEAASRGKSGGGGGGGGREKSREEAPASSIHV